MPAFRQPALRSLFFPLAAACILAAPVSPDASAEPGKEWGGETKGLKYLAYPLGALDGDCLHAKEEDYVRLTRVTAGGPLDKAGLIKGDEIIGYALGTEVTRLPADKGAHETMRALAEAIDAAQAREDGTLRLMVRAGRREGWKVVNLPHVPRFGKNYPFGCKKSQWMFHTNCDWMIANLGVSSPGNVGSWMGLALMCSPDPRHQAHVPKMIKKFEAALSANPDVGHNSAMGWTMTFLSEYSWKHAKDDPAGFLRRKAILEKMAHVLVARQGRANNKGHESAPGYDGVFFHGGGDRCYGGTGQNLATTAAIMGWSNAAKLNGAKIDQAAWDLTYTFLTKKCMGGNDKTGYGIAYSAGGPDGEGSARTAQTGHALITMALPDFLPAAKFPPLKTVSKDLGRLGVGMGKWCLGNSPSTPESHAVGSFPMIAATALIWRTEGIKGYREHMDRWKWYLTLSLQPDGHAHFVPGYIGPAGDNYLGEEAVSNCVSALMLAAPTRKLVMFGAMDPQGSGPDNPYHLGGADGGAQVEYKIGEGGAESDPIGVFGLAKLIPTLQGSHKALLRGDFSEALKRLDELQGKKLTDADKAATEKMTAYVYAQGLDPQFKSIEDALAEGDALSAYRRFNLFKNSDDYAYLGDRKARAAALEAKFKDSGVSAQLDAGRAYEKVLLPYQAQPEEYRPKMEAFAKAHAGDFYGRQAEAALAIQAKNGAPGAGGAAGAGAEGGAGPSSPVVDEDR